MVLFPAFDLSRPYIALVVCLGVSVFVLTFAFNLAFACRSGDESARVRLINPWQPRFSTPRLIAFCIISSSLCSSSAIVSSVSMSHLRASSNLDIFSGVMQQLDELLAFAENEIQEQEQQQTQTQIKQDDTDAELEITLSWSLAETHNAAQQLKNAVRHVRDSIQAYLFTMDLGLSFPTFACALGVVLLLVNVLRFHYAPKDVSVMWLMLFACISACVWALLFGATTSAAVFIEGGCSNKDYNAVSVSKSIGDTVQAEAARLLFSCRGQLPPSSLCQNCTNTLTEYLETSLDLSLESDVPANVTRALLTAIELVNCTSTFQDSLHSFVHNDVCEDLCHRTRWALALVVFGLVFMGGFVLEVRALMNAEESHATLSLFPSSAKADLKPWFGHFSSSKRRDYQSVIQSSHFF